MLLEVVAGASHDSGWWHVACQPSSQQTRRGGEGRAAGCLLAVRHPAAWLHGCLAGCLTAQPPG